MTFVIQSKATSVDERELEEENKNIAKVDGQINTLTNANSKLLQGQDEQDLQEQVDRLAEEGSRLENEQ